MSVLFQSVLMILGIAFALGFFSVAINLSRLAARAREIGLHMKLQGPLVEELVMDLRRRQKRRNRMPRKGKAHGDGTESNPKDAPGA